jgi:hypothetical protein
VANSVQYQRLPPGRPSVATAWLKHRNYGAPPGIIDLSKFTAEWTNWWDGIQSKWGHDAAMYVGGPNGFVIVMLLTTWWGWVAITAEAKAKLGVSVASIASTLDAILGKDKCKASATSNVAAPKAKRYIFLCLAAIQTTKSFDQDPPNIMTYERNSSQHQAKV